MEKTSIIFSFLFSILVNWQNASAQTSGQVTIEGKQFKINGANFYPMVMNYAVELTMPNGSGSSGWANCYLTPYVEYGINNGPNGGPNSYIFECANNSQCASDIVNDWTYLKSSNLKFNTIRVAGFYPKFQFNGGNPNFFFNIRETGSQAWHYLPIDLYTANDPGLDFVLDRYEQLMQLADQTGMKLIFNMIGQPSDYIQFPGPDNDEIDYYDKFLAHLAARVAGSIYAHTVLAFDLWNEPCYFDVSNNKTKVQTCEIISQWYGTVKSHGSTPLVTIGTCGSGDVWFYDPGILKVDFHSLHVYPDFRDFEDRTDPTIQQRAISRMFDELYWFNKISPVPWIIGETGFAASYVLPLASQGTNGANGSLADQADFVQQMLDATCNAGGSGFSWWVFQDGWWFGNSQHEAHWGMLERGYATGDIAGEKPMVNVLRNYSLPTDITTCGPSPVDETTLQTYNPNLTYFNPFQHPANPSKTIKGFLMDQDGNPIANAYVGGHMFVGIHPIFNNEVDPFYRLFTDENGYFELVPYDYLIPNTLLPFEGDLHSLFLTSAGGERLKYSAKWLSNYCSNIMPTPNNPLSWLIHRTNYSYNGEFINIYVVNGESRNIESNNRLTIETSIFYPGAISNIRAKREVHLKSGVHVQNGSLTHIYCTETSINCTNYNGYTMEYKLPGIPLSNNVESNNILELYFNKKENTSGFSVTPNPSNSFFQLQSESNDVVEINMLNMLGEFVTSVRFKNTSEPISVTHLAKGVYILVELNTGKVQKLILQ